MSSVGDRMLKTAGEGWRMILCDGLGEAKGWLRASRGRRTHGNILELDIVEHVRRRIMDWAALWSLGGAQAMKTEDEDIWAVIDCS